MIPENQKRFLFTIALFISMIFADCAKTRNENSNGIPDEINITVLSIPEGAQVFADEQYLGETPASFKFYDIKPTDMVDTNVRISPITLKWVSGATLIDTPIVDYNKYGKDVWIRYERPSNYPKAEIDFDYGIKKRQVDLLEGKLDGINSSIIDIKNNIK